MLNLMVGFIFCSQENRNPRKVKLFPKGPFLSFFQMAGFEKFGKFELFEN
jgi:hypothetical protein